MKTDIWKICSLVSSVLVIAISIMFFQQRTARSSNNKSLHSSINYMDTLMHYSINFNLNNDIGCIQLNNINCHSEDSILSLSDLVKNKPILVYRYANISCDGCVKIILKDLDNIFDKQVNDVLILCSYSTKKEYNYFRKMNNIRLPMYNIDTNALNDQVNSIDSPYFFILYPNLTASNFYIPDIRFAELNEKYHMGAKSLISEY